VVGTLLSGAVTGSFWSLGAVFAQRSHRLAQRGHPVHVRRDLGGAAAAVPVRLAVRSHRAQLTMLALALPGHGEQCAVAHGATHSNCWWPCSFFGATTMPLYAMSLATAADNSLRHEFVEIGTSVLLLNALAAMLAPLALGQLMAVAGQAWLFWGCAGLCGLGSVFIALQVRRPARVEDTVPFSAAAPDMAPTSFDLDPRAPADASGDIDPVVLASPADDAPLES
jgi:hypothetical protein